jgi:hypothetical protein
MNGLSTGNTLYDALILLVPIVLAFVAQRFGLTSVLVWLGEQLVKLKPAPNPEEPKPVEPPVASVNGQALQYAALPGKPVALEWIGLIQLLIPLIMQIIEAFRQRTGRVPTSKEVVEILASGKQDEFVPVPMPTVPERMSD